jgi:hypothetical protein
MRFTSLRRPTNRCSIWVLAALVAAPAALAQVVAPPPPSTYQVFVRYQVSQVRVTRLGQFFAMLKFLESKGFKPAPDMSERAEDPRSVEIEGTVPAKTARQLLDEGHVRALLLIPSGFKLPDADQPVKVQIELKAGLEPERQRILAAQALVFLEDQGFHDAIGYDNRGHTRLLGTINAGALPKLLDDLRVRIVKGERVAPTEEYPEPIRSIWPVRVIEVVAEPAAATASKPAPAEAAVPAGLEKVSPALRALADKDQVVTMEVILAAPPTELDRDWRRILRAVAPGAVVQGRLGAMVTLKAKANLAGSLAQLPIVLTVRLPIRAHSQVLSEPTEGLPGILGSSGLQPLRSIPNGGSGLRIAVLDSDFRGAAGVIGKQLPASTRYIDLSAECDPTLTPTPIDGAELGSGTRTAIALAGFAPAAEFTLVRIDPESPFQVLETARYIQGDEFQNDCLNHRAAQLAADHHALEKERTALLEERAAVLDTFKLDKATLDRREAYFKSQAAFDREEQALRERETRYLKLLKDLKSLRGIRLVVNDLVWTDGHPAEGSSTLAHFFNDRPFRAATWFQAGGLLQGQAWNGLFRDLDGNGVMEFAGAAAPLAAGRWTSELNFLGFQPIKGPAAVDLPKGAYRLTAQWREAHDPSLAGDPALFRQPLSQLKLIILRQRDPQGKNLGTDEFEVVATSSGLPQQLEQSATAATYEQAVEFAVDQPGRYAVRVEGKAPEGWRPASVASVPAANQTRGELRPLLIIQNTDPASRQQGRSIFLDYATDLGTLGVPAAALGVRPIPAAR